MQLISLGKSISLLYIWGSSQFSHLSLKLTNFPLYVWEMSKYPKFIIFLVKSNENF